MLKKGKVQNWHPSLYFSLIAYWTILILKAAGCGKITNFPFFGGAGVETFV